ncbi:glycosyltransferase [Deltaproteobacteria bacterium TL4]
MPQKVICFFNSCKVWGGGEKWHFDISTRLAQKNYAVVFITNQESELFSRLKDTPVKTYGLRISKFSFLNVFKVFKIAKLLKAEKVQTIIMNLSEDLKVAGFASAIAGVPQIIYRRGSAIPIKNTGLNRFLFKRIITEVIANSYETKKTILQNNPDLIEDQKITVIYNGLDLKAYDHAVSKPLAFRQQKRLILGNLGRLVTQKGQSLLLEMAKQLKARGVQFHLVIGGSGPLEASLKEQVQALGLEQDVTFFGFVEDVKSFMESIDLFLLPSLWEGFGYVLVEAMASKKPVIAFDVSSNPEIIDHGKTGFLVEFNNLETFISRIEQLNDAPELRTRYGLQGRDKVKQLFEINQTVLRVENVINKSTEDKNLLPVHVLTGLFVNGSILEFPINTRDLPVDSQKN